jgi:hypothetical protein
MQGIHCAHGVGFQKQGALGNTQLEDLELENMKLGRRIAAKKGSLDLKSKLLKISASAVTDAQALSISGGSFQIDMNLNHAPL